MSFERDNDLFIVPYNFKMVRDLLYVRCTYICTEKMFNDKFYAEVIAFLPWPKYHKL